MQGIFKSYLFKNKKRENSWPGVGPINKNSQIWEIFRKSQKILNLPFLSDKSEKLSSWCFGLASFLEV
jgi:hypothetical protein